MRHSPAPPAGVPSPSAGVGGIVDPAAASRAFTLERLDPAPDLAPYVERHWVVSWDLAPGVEFAQTIVPHPCVNLVVEPRLFAAHGTPAGLSTKHLSGRGVAVGTKFRPAGFHAFLGRALTELRDRTVPATEIFGPLAAETAEGVLAAAGRGDTAAALAVVTTLLRSAAPVLDPRAEVINALVADVVAARLGPSPTVEDLAARAGVSVRTLQRDFTTFVGVTPKWLLQRHRVHLAAERIAADPRCDLAELATQVGYYDQAHLTADFTFVVGLAPGAYARRCAEQMAGASGAPGDA